MPIIDVRILIGDRVKSRFNETIATGNGSGTTFQLDHFPVFTAVTALELQKSGVNLVSGAGTTALNYILDQSGGLITLATALTNGTTLFARRYNYVTFEDEVLSGFLSLEGDNIYLAAARALDAIAASDKHFFDYTQGAVKVEKTKMVKNLMEMADKFRKTGERIDDRDFSITHVDFSELTGSEYEGYETALATRDVDDD